MTPPKKRLPQGKIRGKQPQKIATSPEKVENSKPSTPDSAGSDSGDVKATSKPEESKDVTKTDAPAATPAAPVAQEKTAATAPSEPAKDKPVEATPVITGSDQPAKEAATPVSSSADSATSSSATTTSSSTPETPSTS